MKKKLYLSFEYLKKASLVAVLMLFSVFTIQATEYTVSSADEFNDLCSSLTGGDVVTWTNGTYTDQEIDFYATGGTASNPITLQAETSGSVILNGTSTLNISGDYLVIEGFYWKEGYGEGDHVQFRKSGSGTEFANNCTMRNCAFDNLYTAEPTKSRWIVLHGENNTVENCSFVNKLSAGAAILVELYYAAGLTPGHTIRNNYFYNITAKDDFSTNSGDCEAIRIGVSSFQYISAQVLVEGNYFQEADGENEIITNKSSDNTFLHNTFRSCRGSLVLRHGSGAWVEGNFFLGEGKAKSGGIRVSDSYHTIINNYMQGLSNDGDSWNNGITLVGGSAETGGTSSDYQKVDDIVVAFNTIYNSDDPIYYNDRSSYDPTGVIAYNNIYSTNGTIIAGDISGTGQGMTYVGNIFGGSTIGVTDGGITEGDANFSASGEIYKPSSTGIAANAAGSSYSSTVTTDVEGYSRPSSNMDVGAFEVSGASGSAVYSPITDSQVGDGVGACFLDATASTKTCGETTTVAVTGVSVSPTSATLSVGETQSLSTSISPSTATTKSVTYSSSNTSVATVSTSGVVTAVADGSATITVTTVDGGYTATSSITVSTETINVTGVSVSPTSISIYENATSQLTASVSPSNASNTDVSYSSSNSSVASVSSSGLVTGVSAGTATITVTTDDGNYTATSSVTVSEAPVGLTNVALNKTVTPSGTPEDANPASNLVDGSTDTRVSASGYPQSFTIDLGAVYEISSTELVCYSDRAYQFTVEAAESSSYSTIVDRSSNTTAGTVDSPITDNFTAVNAQYVTITVTGEANDASSWVSLLEFRVNGTEASTVTPIAVTGVSISPTSATLDEGDTQQLTATVSPSDADDASVSYSSSNTSVATVSSNGLVTAVSAGSATITVTTTDGGYTASTSVTVNSTTVITDLPSPWETGDIGAVAATGSASYDNGTFNLEGSGADIWNAADEFRFVYQQVSDDVTITARVVSVENTNAWAKAGVMIRESLNAGSVHAMNVVTPSKGTSFQRRTTTDGTSAHTTTSGITAPQWMRVERSGDTFTASYSADGSSWTTAGSVSISMNSTVYVGLVSTSHEDGILSAASFDNVTVEIGSTSIPVTGVSVSPSSASLLEGETQQLSATVSPSDADNASVSYSSSNTSVATVSSSGLVTAVSAGSATITLTTADGGYTDNTSITVTAESYDAPYSIAKFQAYLAECKLQSPLSSTEATQDEIIAGYSSSTFYVADADKIAFYQTRDAAGTTQRTELRYITNWYIADGDRSLHANVNIVEQTCEQVTIMQIHDDAGVGDGPNAPLLRVYSMNGGLYAAVKTDATGDNTTHISMGDVPTGYFDCDMSIESGNVIVTIDGTEYVNQDVSFWTFPSYWKNGVYLQDEGEAITYFNELTETVSTGETVNLALNQSVSASDEQSTNPASNLVDDDADTRWSASGFPQDATVDLGAVYSISSTEVICFSDRAYQYIIEISEDGNSWTEIVDRSSNTTAGTNDAPITDDFSSVDARYVRMTVSGEANDASSWVSIEELRVYGNSVAVKSAEGIESIAQNNNTDMQVYPNPVVDFLNFEMQNLNGADRIVIYSTTGQLVYSQAIDDLSGSIDINHLSSGMYILRTNGTTPITKRFIKE